MMITINQAIEIPEDELRFTASRGGGPGGQHVNKVASKVTLLFDVRQSPSLTESQRARIEAKLAGRINRDGILQMSSHASRSQAANREALVERFRAVLAEALHRQRARRPTRPTRASQERRITEKKQRAKTKQRRGRVKPERE